MLEISEISEKLVFYKFYCRNILVIFFDDVFQFVFGNFSFLQITSNLA